METTRTMLEAGKRLVEVGNLGAVQEALLEVQGQSSDSEEALDWPWLFQKLYLHACLKGRREIAEWLHEVVFPTLDPIAQIAIRQVFAYGWHLLKTAERRNM